MPELIVHTLEVVEVEDPDTGGRAAIVQAGDALLHRFVEGASIAQFCQRIGSGLLEMLSDLA